jgi:zinc transporter, ZIP family
VEASTLAWIVGSGLGTAVGGLALLLVRRPSDRLLDYLLGFTAGVMLAATCFGLLVPALDEGGIGEVAVGFVLGGAVLAAMDRIIPHAHARFREAGERPAEELAAGRRAVLLVSALTIHNIPEGMAVGLAFAAGGPELGVPIALAIGIQNIPEGFAAAAPLRGAGTSASGPRSSPTSPSTSPTGCWPAAWPSRRERCSTSSSTS